jgi:hypothetical protein
MKLTKIFILLITLFTSQICFGKETFLSCEVSGTYNINGSSRVLPKTKVTVEITEIMSRFISVTGEDDYIIDVSNGKNPPPPTKEVLDFTNDNQYNITNIIRTPGKLIVMRNLQVTINRITGLISYSGSSDFSNGTNITRSLSGSCEKMSKRKF